MKEILFINGCISKGVSRTERLSRALLERLQKDEDARLCELCLEKEKISPLDSESLKKREALTAAMSFDYAMFDRARAFRDADIIVIGAPYWNLGFPAMLRCYLEDVTVPGLTFGYSEDGSENGFCKAKKLYYVTTAGGFIGGNNFGFDYIRALARYMGIKSAECIAAEGLDIEGNNVEKILDDAILKIRKADYQL